MRWLPALALLVLGCTPTPAATPPTMPAPTIADHWTAPAAARATDCHSLNGLPDVACTPGATDPRVTQANLAATICASGYSASVRPSTSVTEPIKRAEMLAYGLADQPLASFELDHLVSLELGGAPAATANLWVEAWTDQPGAPGARSKDKVENAAHREVCRGAIPLAEVQQAIATDWETFGQRLGVLPVTIP